MLSKKEVRYHYELRSLSNGHVFERFYGTESASKYFFRKWLRLNIVREKYRRFSMVKVSSFGKNWGIKQ